MHISNYILKNGCTTREDAWKQQYKGEERHNKIHSKLEHVMYLKKLKVICSLDQLQADETLATRHVSEEVFANLS